MTALVIVDVQNDFCEGGSLEVKDSNAIFPIINQLVKSEDFVKIFLSKDWHPKDHCSFAPNHGKEPFSKIIDHHGEEQVLWPVHCVQESKGAQLSPLLHLANKDTIDVLKGYITTEQCYSAFGSARSPTTLLDHLKKLGVKEVVAVGLALDFCVGNTALDSAREGFKTTVILDATRSVGPETTQQMLEKLKSNHVKLINFDKYQHEGHSKKQSKQKQ